MTKIHVVLTKKDADIAAFKKSLPQGEWSKNITQILNCALRDWVADIPMSFYIKSMDENLHTKISLPDKLVERCYEKFGYEKGGLTIGVKAEIRKCIRKNLKAPTVKRFSSTDITAAFNRVFDHVNEKSEALDDVREKHKLVHKEYHRAFSLMLNTFSKLNQKGNI